MIDASLGPPPASPGGGWREKLAAWARANLANFRRHSWVIETTIHRVPVGPNWLAWLESALRSMSDVGLSAREKIAVVFLVDGHARAAAEISLGVTGTPQWAEDFGRVIERIGGEARFSALASIAAGGGFDKPADGSETAFEFGLQRILDGIDTFVRSGSARPRRRRAQSRRDATRRN
jgi:hypothetical protein